MALKFPDILEHNNPNLPLVDITELKGNSYPLAILAETGSIPSSKRKVGAIIFVSSSQEFYGFYGQTTSSADWGTPSNWRLFPTTTGSFTGSFSGSFTGSLFGTASWAINAETASYVPASAVVGLNLNSITSGSITASVDVASNSFSIVSSSNTLFNVSNAGAASVNPRGLTPGLSISGDTIGTIVLQTTGSSGFSITADSTNGFSIYDINDNNTRFYMNDSGSFGLNTTSVSGYALNVSGSSRFFNDIEISGSLTVSSGSNVLFKVKSNGGVEQGNSTQAIGDYSHAEGDNTQAIGHYSHTEGNGTITSGYGSHAEGISTTALAEGSHAEGGGTIASGERSHAEGEITQAVGYASHAEGFGTIAIGDYSHAEGENTIASGSAQTVMGKYNTQGNNTSLVIIGNGIDDGTRSDLVLFNSTDVAFNVPVSASVFSGSFVGNGAGLTDVPASAISGLNLSQIATGSVSASVFSNSPIAFSIISGSSTLLSVNTASLTTIKNLTVTDNLVVNGTASFINTENLLVKDPFIVLNSGSNSLTDSGLVIEYGGGVGLAWYLSSDSTGTFGRWAVAYDVAGGDTSVPADEYAVTAKLSSGAPSGDPTWGGATRGFGNIYVNSDNGDIFIYS